MNSIVDKNKKCFVCGKDSWVDGIEEHHIFFGTANRKQSERYGLKVNLCRRHHRGDISGVHFNRSLDLQLKRIGQQAFEKNHTREEFMSIFGKNYL